MNVTQPLSGCADLAPYQDIVAFIDVANFTGTLGLALQTSPTLDEALWVSMVSGISPTLGVTAGGILYATATQPLARYVRWLVNNAGGTAWSLTFRIWLGANPKGTKLTRSMAAANRAALEGGGNKGGCGCSGCAGKQGNGAGGATGCSGCAGKQSSGASGPAPSRVVAPGALLRNGAGTVLPAWISSSRYQQSRLPAKMLQVRQSSDRGT